MLWTLLKNKTNPQQDLCQETVGVHAMDGDQVGNV